MAGESVRPLHRTFIAKRDVVGVPVLVSSLRTLGRNMRLEPIHSRVVQRGEIHELITTAEHAGEGELVRDVAYLGFFEIMQGGSLRIDDVMRVNGASVGWLAGFDVTHYPNHLNIVVRMERDMTGEELGLSLEAEIRFTPG